MRHYTSDRAVASARRLWRAIRRAPRCDSVGIRKMQNRFFKVVPEPVGSEPVPIVASFPSQAQADAEADRMSRASGILHIVAYQPSNDIDPLPMTAQPAS